ncbi:hypothetical protein AAG906_001630 [Vitis piasezkii]
MEDKESEISEENKDSDSAMKAIPEKEIMKEEVLKKSTFPPFPQALHAKKGIRNAAEILEYKDHWKSYHFSHDWRKGSGKDLLDLGASVNLLPYTVYKQLGLGELKPTTITLSLADRSVKIPRGEANLVPIILGRPFLATSNAIIKLQEWISIFSICLKANHSEEEEGPGGVMVSESPMGLATLQSWRKIEEILPLFNKEEEAVVEKKFQNSIKPLPWSEVYLSRGE